MNPPPAVPAATLLLLRAGASPLEVFMVVRHHQIDFASGALVFPGGKADDQDFDPSIAERLVGGAEDENMRAIQICAIRETFEESGILLAYEGDGNTLVSGARLEKLDSFRSDINDGKLPFHTFLTREDLRPAGDLLIHFAHWITPEMMPKRFDTHFFLASAPPDQLALHDGYESVDSVWIAPDQVLEEAAAGTRTVIFPTLRNVEKLAEFPNPEDAIEQTLKSDIVPVLPWTERREDGNYLCIPPEAGYRISEEKMPERPA